MNKKIFILAVLITIFLSSKVFAGDFENYYNTGYNAYKKQNYQSAVYYFEKALQANDKFYDTYWLLGISYGLSNNLKKSEEILIKATQKFPDEWRAYTFLGDIKRAQHLTSPAIDYYEKAISLPSMPEDGKKYYKELIRQTIQEQKDYEKLNNNGISNTVTPDITSDLDLNKWYLAYLQGDDTKWILEYGIKGEDVINYKWTKLFTVNFFAKNKYNFDVNTYYSSFKNLLKKQADTTNRTLRINTISESNNEIYFEWCITGRNECEIDRIFTTDKGLYFVHFAQKTEKFSESERTKIINILKSVKTN